MNENKDETWNLFKKRYQEIIPDFDEFLNQLEEPFPTGLRENSLHCLPYSLEEKLKNQKTYRFKKTYQNLNYFEVDGPRKHWGGDLDHHLGLYFMQALSSCFSALALDPKEGESVYDMCAAPGGKTTHLCELMKNRGTLVACEPDINRRRVLKANLTRFGVINTSILAGKAQDIELPQESFDRILLDGPCSSEGTFRRDVISGKKRRKTNYLEYNEVFRKRLHEEQWSLLKKAHGLLKKGGSLVYSTCTYDPEENEQQVTRFLDTFDDVELVAIPCLEELETSPGLREFNQQKFHAGCELTHRIYPHKINSIGFYIAKFTKRS